jgi:hypothetical protein
VNSRTPISMVLRNCSTATPVKQHIPIYQTWRMRIARRRCTHQQSLTATVGVLLIVGIAAQGWPTSVQAGLPCHLHSHSS